MKNAAMIYISKWLFIILFAYTSISKFLDYNIFVFQMRRAPLPLMHSIAPLLGWLIPLIELFLTIGLLINRYSAKAQFASVGLLIIFELYISGMLLSGFPLPCSCGGIISKMSWNQHLIFNGFFICIGSVAIIQIKKYKYLLENFGENSKDLFSA
jgi:putative oxidoreductase